MMKSKNKQRKNSSCLTKELDYCRYGEVFWKAAVFLHYMDVRPCDMTKMYTYRILTKVVSYPDNDTDHDIAHFL